MKRILLPLLSLLIIGCQAGPGVRFCADQAYKGVIKARDNTLEPGTKEILVDVTACLKPVLKEVGAPEPEDNREFSHENAMEAISKAENDNNDMPAWVKWGLIILLTMIMGKDGAAIAMSVVNAYKAARSLSVAREGLALFAAATEKVEPKGTPEESKIIKPIMKAANNSEVEAAANKVKVESSLNVPLAT